MSPDAAHDTSAFFTSFLHALKHHLQTSHHYHHSHMTNAVPVHAYRMTPPQCNTRHNTTLITHQRRLGMGLPSLARSIPVTRFGVAARVALNETVKQNATGGNGKGEGPWPTSATVTGECGAVTATVTY